MSYESWDIRTNNLIDAFDSERDALGALLQVTEEQGERAAEMIKYRMPPALSELGVS